MRIFWETNLFIYLWEDSAAFEQMHLIEFDRAAAFRFAQLRSTHTTLAAPDAVQLACASIAEVELFVTNDRRLSRLSVSGIDRIRAFSDVIAFP